MGFIVAAPRGSAARSMTSSRYTHARSVLAAHYDWYHCSCDAPDDLLAKFRERRTQIGTLELLAAVLPYYTLPRLFVNREVLHWIDNSGAVCGCVKGYTRAPDSARIVHALHALLAGLNVRVWFEYVRSKANIADLPSREVLISATMELGEWFGPSLSRILSERVEPLWPELAAWDEGAAEWAQTFELSTVPIQFPEWAEWSNSVPVAR